MHPEPCMSYSMNKSLQSVKCCKSWTSMTNRDVAVCYKISRWCHRALRHLMAPPELVEIAKHRCFTGTLYRFEHISPVPDLDLDGVWLKRFYGAELRQMDSTRQWLTSKVLGDCTMKLSTFVPSGKGKFPGVARWSTASAVLGKVEHGIVVCNEGIIGMNMSATLTNVGNCNQIPTSSMLTLPQLGSALPKKKPLQFWPLRSFGWVA